MFCCSIVQNHLLDDDWTECGTSCALPWTVPNEVNHFTFGQPEMMLIGSQQKLTVSDFSHIWLLLHHLKFGLQTMKQSFPAKSNAPIKMAANNKNTKMVQWQNADAQIPENGNS